MTNKAIIGIETFEQVQARVMGIARRADAGEASESADYHLNFASAAQLFAELTPARLALLDLLKQAGPLTVYGLAKRAGRNYSNVHRDAAKLLEHDLVEKDEQGRLFVPWEAVEIHVAVAGQAAHAPRAAVARVGLHVR